MDYLVDTGVLLRLFDSSDSANTDIRRALKTIRSTSGRLFTTAQNISEFWNVSTRPSSARGGYGQSAQITNSRVQFIERYTSVLTETAVSYQHWRSLVVDHAITGVSVHDAKLVSIMLANGIQKIVTLNATDFQRYPGIEAVLPATV